MDVNLLYNVNMAHVRPLHVSLRVYVCMAATGIPLSLSMHICLLCTPLLGPGLTTTSIDAGCHHISATLSSPTFIYGQGREVTQISSIL